MAAVSARAGQQPEGKRERAKKKGSHPEDEHKASFWVFFLTYMIYGGLFVLGYCKDFVGKLFSRQRKTPKGYAPLLRDFEDFYTRNLYHRIQDCWNRPISSVPGAHIKVILRETSDNNKTLQCTKETKDCINLSSYNYLGFAQTSGKCIEDSIVALHKYSTSTCGPAVDYGYTELHQELESSMAKFLHKEDALVIGMGFATNSTVIPALGSKGTLLISDSLNHSSLIVGARGGSARIRVFKHNDCEDLERVVRESIRDGQPRTHRPWDRIIILVEGIYSMEGVICNLPEIIRIKKQYKCYLYVDEAHSIGALGENGGGVVEYFGANHDDVDILMGTFTKSFGAVGGYIAGDKHVIDYLRKWSWGTTYACNMSPACVRMILSAFEVIQGKDGTNLGREKIRRLGLNSNYFRDRLTEMGFMTIGSRDSPIIPVLTYIPTMMPAVSRECLKAGLAVVVVGFPATGVVDSRCRFCISASHTKEDLDKALDALDIIGDRCMVKFQAGNAKVREEARQRLKNMPAKW